MAYTFDQIFAADPSNPGNVAANGVVTIFAPGDATQTPLSIMDTAGNPLANPVTVNANGYGDAFSHATLDRVAWAGGGFSGFFTSYEGLKEEAVAARLAAEKVLGGVPARVSEEVAAVAATGAFKGDPGRDGSNVVPTAQAIATEIETPGTPANTALSATYVGDGSAVDVTDKASGYNINLVDAASNGAIMLHLDHAGNGSDAAYALDFRNRPGARTAIVGHQYSGNGPFMWIDNTDSAAAIRIHNTQNTTLNPGRDGTGDFIELMDHGTKILYLNKDLTFVTNQGTKNVTFLNTVGKALSVQQASSYTGSAPGLEVQKLGTGTGAGVDLTNAGSGRGLHVRQNGANNGVQIDMGAGAAGFYPMLLNGQNYGPKYVTTTDGGMVLTIEKNGTGAGGAVRITNKGTGDSLSVWDANGQVARVDRYGAFVSKASNAPLTSELVDGEFRLWVDAATGNFKVTSRVAGVLKTATVAVA